MAHVHDSMSLRMINKGYFIPLCENSLPEEALQEGKPLKEGFYVEFEPGALVVQPGTAAIFVLLKHGISVRPPPLRNV